MLKQKIRSVKTLSRNDFIRLSWKLVYTLSADEKLRGPYRGKQSHNSLFSDSISLHLGEWQQEKSHSSRRSLRTRLDNRNHQITCEQSDTSCLKKKENASLIESFLHLETTFLRNEEYTCVAAASSHVLIRLVVLAFLAPVLLSCSPLPPAVPQIRRPY